MQRQDLTPPLPLTLLLEHLQFGGADVVVLRRTGLAVGHVERVVVEIALVVGSAGALVRENP